MYLIGSGAYIDIVGYIYRDSIVIDFIPDTNVNSTIQKKRDASNYGCGIRNMESDIYIQHSMSQKNISF